VKPKYDEPLSNFAFKFHLRRHRLALLPDAAKASLVVGPVQVDPRLALAWPRLVSAIEA
jgi:hypothetical protein